MATWEWACPHCGQKQRSREASEAGKLCAACDELAQEAAELDELVSQGDEAEKSRKAKRRASA